MKPLLKKALIGVGALVGAIALGGGGFVWMQASSFDEAMAKTYDIPPLNISASQDAAVIARGEHLARSISACAGGDCHGSDFSGGKTLVMGPLGTLTGPNITPAGMLGVYTDGELARVIRHGIKKSGTSLLFMPSHEINYLPDDDLTALVSFLRSVPGVDKPNGPIQVGLLGKVLDRAGKIVLDVAGHIDHANIPIAGPPAPSAEYGKFLTLACTGCHGTTFSGGPIPGAPSDLPVPTNITPHETGIKDWNFDDFNKLLDEGVKKDGTPLNPFMPVTDLRNMNEIERKAMWEFLRTVAPKEFGGR